MQVRKRRKRVLTQRVCMCSWERLIVHTFTNSEYFIKRLVLKDCFGKQSQGTRSWLGFLISRAYVWAVLLPLFVTQVIDTEGFTCFLKKVQKCTYPTFILGKYWQQWTTEAIVLIPSNKRSYQWIEFTLCQFSGLHFLAEKLKLLIAIRFALSQPSYSLSPAVRSLSLNSLLSFLIDNLLQYFSEGKKKAPFSLQERQLSLAFNMKSSGHICTLSFKKKSFIF